MTVPDFETFEFKYPKGKYLLKIITNTNVIKTDTVNITRKDAYVYIQYQERRSFNKPVATGEMKKIELLITDRKQRIY